MKVWHLIVACLVTALLVSAAYRDDHRTASAVRDIVARNQELHITIDSGRYVVGADAECVIEPARDSSLTVALAKYAEQVRGYR